MENKLTIKQYIENKGLNISPTAVLYLIDHGIIDAEKIGRQWFVVMTEKTEAYIPNGSSAKGRKARKNHL